MKPDRALSMVGIAARAGSIASGEFSTEKALKSGKAYLVIVVGRFPNFPKYSGAG